MIFPVHIGAMKTAAAAGNGLLTNLVSYWKLDEVSGTRADAHGVNDLTENGTVGNRTGVISNGADLSYQNFLNVTASSIYGISGSLSVSTWINPDVVATAAPVSVWDSPRKFLIYVATNKLRFYIQDSTDTSAYFAESTTTISTATWYHVVGVFESGSSVKIYVNGSLEGTNSTSIPAATNQATARLDIGQFNQAGANANSFNGVIDEPCIWSRVLSAADVTALYNSGNGLAYGSFTS